MIYHVNEIDLFYEVVGHGDPLIMVHGNGEDHTIFEEAVSVLKDKYTCYCIDSRGHGQSTSVSELHYYDMAQDVIQLIEGLDLNNVSYYGFSDGGIIGLIAASECKRITRLIVSGANLTPKGVKPRLRVMLRLLYLLKRDPKIGLMLNEPNITTDTLQNISARTLVLAGSKDLITEKETRQIASGIANAQLRILEGEGHGTYIVHNKRIGELILDF